MSTQPVRPTKTSLPEQMDDAFGALGMELRVRKRILRAPEPPPKKR